MTALDKGRFESVLIRLLRSSRLVNWPRKPEQKQVLLKSVALMIDGDRIYAETQIDDVILEWLEIVGVAVQIDHANIRRMLIDERYLARDPAGREYRLSGEQSQWFEATVDGTDIRALLKDGLKPGSTRRFGSNS